MKSPEKNKAIPMLIKFCEYYKKRDLMILELFTTNIVLWGTGMDEYFVGLKEVEKQLKREWQQAEKGEIEIISFVPAPSHANWVAAICKAIITIESKIYIFENLRGTIILEKENNNWKIGHLHASFPDYRNPSGNPFPINA